MDTLVADILVEKSIKDNNDQRTRVSLKNIKAACKALIEERSTVSPTNVGNYCLEHYGKPSVRTLLNDSKGTYRPILDAYARFNPQSKAAKSIAKSAKSQGVPTHVLIHIDMLEKRNKMLENILKEQFYTVNDQMLPSIDKTLKKGASSTDSAQLTDSQKLTRTETSAIKLLFHALTDYEVCKVIPAGTEETLMAVEGGEVILNARQFAAIKKLIE